LLPFLAIKPTRRLRRLTRSVVKESLPVLEPLGSDKGDVGLLDRGLVGHVEVALWDMVVRHLSDDSLAAGDGRGMGRSSSLDDSEGGESRGSESGEHAERVMVERSRESV
jgi:hypothetical protein